MPYDPNTHHRRSIRLRGYDYSQAGVYFVTICTHGRARIFDDAALRQIAEEQWQALNSAGLRGASAGRVHADAWVVMPDHVHGIIVIGDVGGDDGVGDDGAGDDGAGDDGAGDDGAGDGVGDDGAGDDGVGDGDDVGAAAGNASAFGTPSGCCAPTTPIPRCRA